VPIAAAAAAAAAGRGAMATAWWVEEFVVNVEK
jgi:hypothetical protein